MTITLTKDELQAVLAGQQASICKIAEMQETIGELVRQVDDLSFLMELCRMKAPSDTAAPFCA